LRAVSAHPLVASRVTSGYSSVLAENAHYGFELIQKALFDRSTVARVAQSYSGTAFGRLIVPRFISGLTKLKRLRSG
jgi:hypothetical protein